MPRRICAPVSTVPAASQPPGGSFRESVMKREQTSCPSLSNQRAALHVNLITDQGQLPPDALHVIHTEISACLPSGGLQLLTGSSSGSLGLGSSLATHCGIYPPAAPIPLQCSAEGCPRAGQPLGKCLASPQPSPGPRPPRQLPRVVLCFPLVVPEPCRKAQRACKLALLCRRGWGGDLQSSQN